MSTKSSRSTKGKQLQLLDDEKIVIGVDMHKNTYFVAFWSLTRQEIISSWTQPAEPKALFKRFEPFQARITQIYYEAGPTGFSLAHSLLSLGFPVKVIAPSHTPTNPKKPAKCDRLDACRLAEYGAKELLTCVHIPSVEEERQRQVMRHREQIAKNVRVAKQRIRSLLLYHGIAEPEKLKHWSRRAVAQLRALELPHELRFVLHSHLDDLSHFEDQLSRVDKEVARLTQCEQNAGPFQHLRSIPHFGPTTAMVLITEMPEPKRFETPRQVTSFQGLAPGIQASGETVKEGPLADGGNRRLRTALVEAAWRWVSNDPGAGLLYKRMLSKTGKKQKAIVAVARRLGVIAWKLMTGTENYDPSRLEKQLS